MNTVGTLVLFLTILAMVQIFVGLKYLKILKSVERMVKECSHPIFTQDINRRETLAAIEKKVDRMLEEMIKLPENIKRVKNSPSLNKKK